MLTYTFRTDDDLWLVINALGDKISTWHTSVHELREHLEKSGRSRGHPWTGLADQLERQAKDAERIRDELVAGEEA